MTSPGSRREREGPGRTCSERRSGLRKLSGPGARGPEGGDRGSRAVRRGGPPAAPSLGQRSSGALSSQAPHWGPRALHWMLRQVLHEQRRRPAPRKDLAPPRTPVRVQAPGTGQPAAQPGQGVGPGFGVRRERPTRPIRNPEHWRRAVEGRAISTHLLCVLRLLVKHRCRRRGPVRLGRRGPEAQWAC